MSATTLTHAETTVAPTLDFAAGEARMAEEAFRADRELCQRYLGTWADSYGKTRRDTSIGFAEFAAAAKRLENSRRPARR